ncbi:MAG: cyclic pyranopterin monophosphate synthase MoaC [Thermoplasmataceae archaeon]|jgi:cyclic pyranopterin phosphate synthase
MIDISSKDIVRRYARASGFIALKQDTLMQIKNGTVKKGDVFESAKIAAILGAKEAWMRLPYCHQIPLESVNVFSEVKDDGFSLACEVSAGWKTGVEMDALSAVSAGLLTVWDMVKYLEKDETGNYPSTLIKDIKVELKVKGDA